MQPGQTIVLMLKNRGYVSPFLQEIDSGSLHAMIPGEQHCDRISKQTGAKEAWRWNRLNQMDQQG
jgi:hypothetical protein